MLTKKGQSALEYMMTYRWVILIIVIIVIVVVILYSRGIFNPPSFITSTTITGFSGVSVTAAVANNNLLALSITNNIGNPIIITGINITSGGKTYSTFQCGNGNAVNFTLAPNKSTICQIAGSYSSSISSPASISYTVESKLIHPSTSKGTIRTPVSSSTQIKPIPGLFAYVANGANTVSVINIATNTVVSTITVGSSPLGIAITPNGQYAYVTNYDSNTVSVINTSTNTNILNITVGSNPAGIAITPNGQYAYVTNSYSNTVSVINTATNTVVSTITVGLNPFGIAITPNGQYAYVTNNGANTVSIINTSTNTVVSTITVGSSPLGVAIGNSNSNGGI